jgi:hypothetical protein
MDQFCRFGNFAKRSEPEANWICRFADRSQILRRADDGWVAFSWIFLVIQAIK